MSTSYKNILIIKMSALGDIIHSLPTLHALRTLYPDARISWLVEPQFSDLLPGAPYIDEKIVFYKNTLKKQVFFEKLRHLRSLRKTLKNHNFDLVIDLQGLAKSALISLLSGCKNRIGYCEMREGSFLVSRAVSGLHAKGHVVERYLDVARHLGASVEKGVFPLPSFPESTRVNRLLSDAFMDGSYAVFFPGAGWESKEWAPERYAELAKKLINDGIHVVLCGGPADETKGEKIRKLVNSDKLLDIVGKTDMTDIFSLAKRALFCVGGDTGPLHIAAAVSTPTVSLFGPSSWERAHPYGDLDTVINTTASCSPCFKRKCPKTFICMDKITVNGVYEACRKHFQSSSP
jgi:heptosyltransferase-1/heptosyltransferase-2